jgi:membrane protein DedA with SNARE-associated domain/rhodanese-related sulfurtransferase
VQIAALTSTWGLLLVLLNVLIDQLGLPVPAVPTLVVAGAYFAPHRAWGMEVWIGAVAACVLADLAWYWAGRLYGNSVMRLLCRVSLSPDSCVSETQRRFEDWGSLALILGKFVPGLAIIAPPLAGALRMSQVRFVALSSAAAALWVGSFLLIGALFQRQINEWLPKVAALGDRAIAAVLGLLILYVAFRWFERWRFHRKLRMARISVTELYELMGAERAPIVLDVRSHSARQLEPRWIPASHHVPPERAEEYLKHLPRDQDVVLYCTCPNEASAARVAKLLIAHGFTRVRPLHGGLDAWIAAGYAVDSAEPTLSVTPIPSGAVSD